MTAKQWLSRGKFIDRELAELERAREAVYERLTATVGFIGDDKVSTTPDPHKFDRLAHLSVQIDREKARLEQTKAEILETIYKLDEPRYREILLLYYVQGLTWEQVAGELHYGKRHATRLHGFALDAVRKYIPGVK